MKYFPFILCAVLLIGCGHNPTTNEAETTSCVQPSIVFETEEAELTAPHPTPDRIRLMLNEMTLEERVGQLFLIRCNQASVLEDISAYHPGGLVLFNVDFENQTPETMHRLLAGYQLASKIPLLLAVDEEGGTVNRISRNVAFRSSPFPSPRSAFAEGGLDLAVAIEEEKCQLMQSLGLNLNLGPVCDLTDDAGAFMYSRSIGLAPEETGEFVSRTILVKNAYRIGSALKHFPGYGNNTDTHVGIAVDSRPLEDYIQRDLIPFYAGIKAGAGCILVSHTIVEALDETMPASLSPAVHQFLREDMDFDGVILTDDLVMDAITEQYGAGEAAVLAILAGNDLLCSTEYSVQYRAVLDAVLEGRIDIDVLNAAVRHVLQWKIDLGMI